MMVAVFAGILCCYLVAVLGVHLAARRARGPGYAARHYVLIGGTGELRLEAYIRALRWYALSSGRAVRITLVDRGMGAEQYAVWRRLAREGDAWVDGEASTGAEALQQSEVLQGTMMRPESIVRPEKMVQERTSAAEALLTAPRSFPRHAPHVLVDLRDPYQLERLPVRLVRFPDHGPG
ncbi:hypothetical protein IDH44_11620 [Paenibacillus sp. IB182496]|uniref:Uncharacterized protein n=1 Tax=Paenibacillus sabuli TaxID=2772509 RepID=A0A927BTZ2_9BACL|nr:hypothetical protein [Paenibacillus sabuli]MBD2845841.1 hypothetical protein [Paenibacillus sabuli]